MLNRYRVRVQYGIQCGTAEVAAYDEQQAIYKAMGLSPGAKSAYVIQDDSEVRGERQMPELADPEDMAIELEEVQAASRAEIDAAFDEGCEDGAFTPERWREGKARAAYVDGWNRCNPEDQR
jgi:hypothetical protein